MTDPFRLYFRDQSSDEEETDRLLYFYGDESSSDTSSRSSSSANSTKNSNEVRVVERPVQIKNQDAGGENHEAHDSSAQDVESLPKGTTSLQTIRTRRDQRGQEPVQLFGGPAPAARRSAASVDHHHHQEAGAASGAATTSSGHHDSGHHHHHHHHHHRSGHGTEAAAKEDGGGLLAYFFKAVYVEGSGKNYGISAGDDDEEFGHHGTHHHTHHSGSKHEDSKVHLMAKGLTKSKNSESLAPGMITDGKSPGDRGVCCCPLDRTHPIGVCGMDKRHSPPWHLRVFMPCCTYVNWAGCDAVAILMSTTWWLLFWPVFYVTCCWEPTSYSTTTDADDYLNRVGAPVQAENKQSASVDVAALRNVPTIAPQHRSGSDGQKFPDRDQAHSVYTGIINAPQAANPGGSNGGGSADNV
ncbi:unnamed protein product [Amoebophrya sp. A120]|nr:unnamed protein product [Amoebophrya sp. A120]|eukprot:GSA120T00017821001.1